jgi:tripartite-type tricarboxylate transporter receptor subunit TctC
MMVPALTPAPVIRTLHEGVVKAVKSKEVSSRLSNEGAVIIANTPREFADFIKAESDKWTSVIRKAKVRLTE